MGSLTPEQLETRLRKRLSSFFNRSSAWRPALDLVEEAASRRGWRLLLFGGTLRDLCMSWSAAPRDLDFVVPGASIEELETEFSGHIERRTRFGGLHLRIGPLPIDIWPLEQTWAFSQRELGLRPEPEALPRTTFLSAEAAAVEVQALRGRPRRIYSGGLFESFATSTLEINLEANPCPDLCVVRSLVTLRRLGFSIGPRLTRYLVEHGKRLPMEQLEQTQLAHYGNVLLSRDAMWADLNAIDQQRAAGRSIVRLPFAAQSRFPGMAPVGAALGVRSRRLPGPPRKAGQ